MKKQISQIIFLQMIVILFGSLIIYFVSYDYVDVFLISLAVFFAVLTFMYFIYIRHISGLGEKTFSLTMLFILSYFIVFFQFPVDFILKSFSDNSIYTTIIYDESVLVKSIWYALSFLIIMCLGMHFQSMKIRNSKNSFYSQKKINERPFFYLFYILFFLHLITVDSGYYQGDVSEGLQGIAASILGYFIFLLPICFGIVIFNYKLKKDYSSLSFLKFIKLFPFLFLVIIFAFSSLTFLAGDRGPAIRALILLAASYYIITNKKVSYLKFAIMIVLAGFFLSTIKLVGAINYNDNLVEGFLAASERLGGSAKAESFSPFTSELASSFRAYNTGFSLWDSGYSLYGLGMLVGIIMSLPYAVTVFMQAFNLSKADINTSNLITEYVGEVYGLGTTLVGDALLNIGFIPSLILAFFIGRCAIKIDYNLFIKPSNIYIYVLGLYFLMNSVVLVRSSIFPTIGNCIFIFCIVFLIKNFGKSNIR